MEPRIRLENVVAGYGTKVVLTDVSFEVLPGHILTLMGPNGSGKSTIIKTLSGQIPSLGGNIFLGEKNINLINRKDVAKQMSVMLTERPNPEYMTCRDIVEMGRIPYAGKLGNLSLEDEKIVEETMELINITALSDNLFRNISDGQRQRVMLARAIAQEPSVLIMDEPTTFLDIRYKIDLLTILKNLVHKKQIAVILSLHELELAGKISDEILCVRNGGVGAYGKTEDVFTGDYIQELYEIEDGKYIESFGSIELTPVKGEPKVFVIAGGGEAINIYHKLWREDIPFACGVMAKNDMEYPIADVLAQRVISSPAFCRPDEALYDEAVKIIDSCDKVICNIKSFEEYNIINKRLYEYAISKGKIKS